VRVRASSTLVGTEPLRFRVQILEIATHSDPIRVGYGFTPPFAPLSGCQLEHGRLRAHEGCDYAFTV
jgi:hypothetical protein